MIHFLDEALEACIKSDAVLSEQVALSFGVPNQEWIASLTGPAINVFLWRITKDESRSSSGMIESQDPNGGPKIRRAPFPRIALSYFVSAHAQQVADEHFLLGQVAKSVLANQRLPDEFLNEDLKEIDEPYYLSLSTEFPQLSMDFWRSVGAPLKSGFDLRLSAPVNTQIQSEVGPDVTARELRTKDLNAPSRESSRTVEN